MNYYVGWDVGAWHCDRKGQSQDALCALKGEWDNLDLAGEFWRGNLREALVAEDSVLAAILEKVRIKPEGHRVAWAVDTPLGWPNMFRELACGIGDAVHVPKRAGENPYLFRQTECRLFREGFCPLSTVKDRIGSQSTKGMHFLRRCGFSRLNVGVWRVNGHTAIETYPAPAKTSERLQRAFTRLQAPLLGQAAARGDNARKDAKDSLVRLGRGAIRIRSKSPGCTPARYSA